LERATIEDMARLCDFLKTSISFCCGVEKISEEETEEAENAAVIENNRRMQFYVAADNKLGQLALQEDKV
jgi:hypothetical protein